MSELVTRRLVIRGVVQGVGYRWTMREAALAGGVSGWVRNRADGSVEAIVQGTPEAVGRIIDWAHRGPRGARVDVVDVEDATGRFASFETRPTA